jgi:hypothetical protein
LRTIGIKFFLVSMAGKDDDRNPTQGNRDQHRAQKKKKKKNYRGRDIIRDNGWMGTKVEEAGAGVPRLFVARGFPCSVEGPVTDKRRRADFRKEVTNR